MIFKMISLLSNWCYLKSTHPLCIILVKSTTEGEGTSCGSVQWDSLHIQIPPTGYVGLILCSTAMATASWGYIWMYSDPTVTGAMAHAIAAGFPCSTLKDTSTGSNHRATALYETNVASQEESGCVLKIHTAPLKGFFFPKSSTVGVWIKIGIALLFDGIAYRTLPCDTLTPSVVYLMKMLHLECVEFKYSCLARFQMEYIAEYCA